VCPIAICCDELVAAHTPDSLRTRVQPFFGALFTRDASGRSWLADLLRATPHGVRRLGPKADRPGYLLTSLAVRGASGALACFEYPATPSRDLLLWLVDHPGKLTWPHGAAQSAETERLRRVLIDDNPPGVRARAQERARDRARTASPFASDWWRFETASLLDCVLITDELVVTVVGRRAEPLGSATPWYPQRSQLVRDIEAAGQIAQGRAWGSVLISDELLADGSPDAVAASLPAGAPHLTPDERFELESAYLGNITWRQACDAVGYPNQLLDESAAATADQQP
jgi:hypothetical protein